MPSTVDSAFDVAFWLADTALNQNEYLQPQKLQRLLFLAQGYHFVAFGGRKLMPAIFIADEMGPVEPNVYLAFSKGRPDIDVDLFMSPEAEAFLDKIWRRFGHYSSERLTRMCKETIAYKQAMEFGKRIEITPESMRLSFAKGENSSAAQQVVRPKVMRTQSGRAVTVKSWLPSPKD